MEAQCVDMMETLTCMSSMCGEENINFLIKKIPLILDKFQKILIVVIYIENIEYA